MYSYICVALPRNNFLNILNPKAAPVRKRGTQNIDAGKESAMEAESRAAIARATVPFDQRVRSFLEMLHESDVSAFSPWEKELHKIVFDSRYLLLDSRERKQVIESVIFLLGNCIRGLFMRRVNVIVTI